MIDLRINLLEIPSFPKLAIRSSRTSSFKGLGFLSICLLILFYKITDNSSLKLPFLLTYPLLLYLFLICFDLPVHLLINLRFNLVQMIIIRHLRGPIAMVYDTLSLTNHSSTGKACFTYLFTVYLLMNTAKFRESGTTVFYCIYYNLNFTRG